MIRGAAGIAQLVRYVPRGYEGIARPENKNLISDGDFQLSRSDIVRFILARVYMTRHAYPWRQAHFEEAISTSGICTG